ncbi:MAG: apolipoprotein N-acyltransferase [Hydrogenophilales bacterium]|nr:apolipoprotein N-acyltransferase [Hydrogenophilales bacterium]
MNHRYSTLFRITRDWGLPPILGVLSALGFAPVHVFPLPIICVALLFISVRHNLSWAFSRAYLFGLGWFLAGVSWVYISLHDMGQLPAPIAVVATLGFSMLLALFPALAIWLPVRANLGDRWRWLLLAPLLWALMEWLRGWLLTGFPWQAIGYSQVPWSPLAGYAPILGVYGVSWLAALSAGFLALRWRAGWLLLGLLWLGGYGLQRVEWTHPVGKPISVSMVQGNISQETKFLPEKLAETLAMYRQKVVDSETRLVILPETALPVFIEELPKWFLEELAEPMRARGGDLITGIAEQESGERYYNSMISLGSSPQQRFRKVHLVPFGEFVPFGFRWLVNMMQIPLGDFTRGQPGQPPMALSGQKLAVNICYEDVFGEELIHALPAATLMVNASNDAWFGNSFAPWQHLQIGQMRALETGRVWLKANNTGITAIVDEKGHVVERLEPFTRDVLVGQVQGRQGMTPYAHWGNFAFLGLSAAGLLLAWLRARRRG